MSDKDRTRNTADAGVKILSFSIVFQMSRFKLIRLDSIPFKGSIVHCFVARQRLVMNVV